MAVLMHSIGMLFSVLILSVIVSMIMGSSFVSSIEKMRRIFILIIIIAVIQSLFSPSGKAIVSVGGLSLVTSGGLEKGTIVILRMAIIIVSAAVMTTSNPREIVQGFVQWKVPYEIAFMVSVAIRFLPLLTDEIRDTFTAIQLRGIDLGKIPVKKRLKVYSYLFMPVVLGTIVKSQELSTAMEMRAFRAYTKRTSYMVLYMDYKDYAAIFISIALCAIMFILYYKRMVPGGVI
jgi:ABC-type cobalt transport system, permease component CbiQ and related transporters